MTVQKEQLVEKLKTIIDPEINLDIYNLGLIYGIKIEEKDVLVTMTLTSPMCPFGPEIIAKVKEAVKEVGGEPQVDLTFDPPWEPSDDVKMMLGLL